MKRKQKAKEAEERRKARNLAIEKKRKEKERMAALMYNNCVQDAPMKKVDKELSIKKEKTKVLKDNGSTEKSSKSRKTGPNSPEVKKLEKKK